MRLAWLVIFSCALVALVADPATQTIALRIDSVAAQKRLEKDPRLNQGGAPVLLTPQFDVLEVVSGVRSALKLGPGGVWTAELVVPVPENERLLGRLALIPAASAGPDAVRAIGVLQDLWSASDPWPLVRGLPAWAWGTRDPRYNAKNAVLLLSFPPTP